MRCDELGALLGVELDQPPLLVGEFAVREQDRVGEDELADVVQQRGGVDEVQFALSQPQHRGHRARVTRDRARVARGHRVAHRERLHHGREDADLERAELFGASRELLAALVGLHARARDVVDDDHDHDQQDERGEAEPSVAEGHTGRQERRGELERQHGPADRPECLRHADNASQVVIHGRRGEAGYVREHEDDRDRGRERERLTGVEGPEHRAAEQRDRRVGHGAPDPPLPASTATRAITAAPTGPTSAIASTSAGSEPDRRAPRNRIVIALPAQREEQQEGGQE